ncbi:MAG: hypothetical protein ACK4N5_08250, partial [Myxococcales bacterium]
MLKRSAVFALVLLAACDSETPPSNNPPPKDTQPPEITAVSVRSKRSDPSRAGKGDTLDITFKVNEPLAKVEVRLVGALAACLEQQGDTVSCGYTLTGRESDGVQTVTVKGTDAAGNVGQATGEFTIDFTAPVLTLTRVPPALSNISNVELAFEASEPSTFACKLDDAAPVACTSPHVFGGVGDGAHTVVVTATDDVGNASSASASFTLDLVAPDTTLLTTPPALSQQHDV